MNTIIRKKIMDFTTKAEKFLKQNETQKNIINRMSNEKDLCSEIYMHMMSINLLKEKNLKQKKICFENINISKTKRKNT